MSFDVTTLALAKSYADQHGGGGGASTAGDFIIKMTVASDGDYNYTVTSCDATIEQIDAAVADGKRVVVIASIDGSILELPMLQGVEGNIYYFSAFSGSQIATSFVEKIGNTSNWEFDMNQIQSEDVGYSNPAPPNGVTNVKMALDALVPNSHNHTNKDTLDKLSALNGKLQYNGSDVGLKGDKGAAGKSAYQYAQEGGYTGTETEFAEKLASGVLIVNVTDNNGTLSADKTFLDIRDAIIAGIPVLVSYDGMGLHLVGTLADALYFGTIMCENDGIDAAVGTNIIEITSNGEVNDVSATIEIPKTLPNPNAITFTGAVTGSYDGSSPMSVNIPSAVTDDHINSLIDTKLGVIENGSY